MNLPDLFNGSTSEVPEDAALLNALGNRTATLHVSGDMLDPDAVSNLFGVTPTDSEMRGLPIVRPDGSEERVATAGRWSFGVGGADLQTLTANEALEALLARLPHDRATWQAVGGMGTMHVAVSLVVDTGNAEIWLEPRLLSFLGERAVGLYFELFQAPQPPVAVTGVYY